MEDTHPAMRPPSGQARALQRQLVGWGSEVKPQKETFKQLNVDLSCVDLPHQAAGRRFPRTFVDWMVVVFSGFFGWKKWSILVFEFFLLFFLRLWPICRCAGFGLSRPGKRFYSLEFFPIVALRTDLWEQVTVRRARREVHGSLRQTCR